MPQFSFPACSGSEHHAATLMSCFAALPSAVAAEFPGDPVATASSQYRFIRTTPVCEPSICRLPFCHDVTVHLSVASRPPKTVEMTGVAPHPETVEEASWYVFPTNGSVLAPEMPLPAPSMAVAVPMTATIRTMVLMQTPM